MIILGIIFLVLFTFFSMCLAGCLTNIQKEIQRQNKRLDEVIRIMKR